MKQPVKDEPIKIEIREQTKVLCKLGVEWDLMRKGLQNPPPALDL